MVGVSDRLKESLERFVRSVSPDFDFLRTYAGTVVAAGADPNTFDFTPDDQGLDGLQSVPLSSELGLIVTLPVGQQARAWLAFAGGKPSAPFLDGFAIFGTATLAQGVARLNDQVQLAPEWAAWFAAVQVALSTIPNTLPTVLMPVTGPFGFISTASQILAAQ